MFSNRKCRFSCDHAGNGRNDERPVAPKHVDQITLQFRPPQRIEGNTTTLIEQIDVHSNDALNARQRVARFLGCGTEARTVDFHVPFEHAQVDFVLVDEVVIERALGQTTLLGEFAHGQAGIAVAGNDVFRSVQDRLF